MNPAGVQGQRPETHGATGNLRARSGDAGATAAAGARLTARSPRARQSPPPVPPASPRVSLFLLLPLAPLLFWRHLARSGGGRPSSRSRQPPASSGPAGFPEPRAPRPPAAPRLRDPPGSPSSRPPRSPGLPTAPGSPIPRPPGAAGRGLAAREGPICVASVAGTGGSGSARPSALGPRPCQPPAPGVGPPARRASARPPPRTHPDRARRGEAKADDDGAARRADGPRSLPRLTPRAHSGPVPAAAAAAAAGSRPRGRAASARARRPPEVRAPLRRARPPGSRPELPPPGGPGPRMPSTPPGSAPGIAPGTRGGGPGTGRGCVRRGCRPRGPAREPREPWPGRGGRPLSGRPGGRCAPAGDTQGEPAHPSPSLCPSPTRGLSGGRPGRRRRSPAQSRTRRCPRAWPVTSGGFMPGLSR